MKTLFIIPICILFLQINSFAQVSACNENFSSADKDQIVSKISGQTVVCDFVMNGSEKYEVAPMPGINEYIWTVPEGVVIVEGQGSNSVQIQIDNNFTGGEIILNASGSGMKATLSKTINLLPNAPVFNNVKSFAQAGQTAVFSVEDNGETFTWEAPKGSEIISGQGTAEVKIQFGKNFSGGFVAVSANNNCGLSLMSQTFVSNLTSEPSNSNGIESILAQTNNSIK